ncbi:MAG: YkoF family thiamine/hydroxymethylpyrimidine-binding protein [Cytophagales bacterium]
MDVSVDISLYPLENEYIDTIWAFIDLVKANKNLTVVTNGLSTQVFGEYKEVMGALTEDILQIFDQHKAVFVLKIAKGIHRLDP